MEHDRRLLQPGQDPLRHGAEPPRPGVGDRVEQAAEGVQVVAVHPGPPGRQGVNELGVGVVGDVEQVEPPDRLAGVPGEEDEPIEQPIGVERGTPPADHRQPGGEPAERRAEAGGLHGERPIPRQVVEKHVPAQVHAPPPLLREVSQDCEVVGHRSPSPSHGK